MRLATLVAGLALFAVPALAEPVTYHWTGTVVSVTDGTNGTYDLRGTFSNGQAATVDMTVERTTVGTPAGVYYTNYVDAVTELTGTIGTYALSGKFPSSTLYVGDNNPDNGFMNDDFFAIVHPLTGDPVGTLNLSDANFSFEDPDGLAFTSQVLPRPFPNVTDFAIRGVDVSWSSLTIQGVVRVEFDAGSTPALATSWGGIKNLYRQ